MPIFDVQKFLRVAAIRTFFDDENFPGLTNDEKPPRTIRRFAHPHRAVNLQIWENLFEFNLRKRLRRRDAGKHQRTKKPRQKKFAFTHALKKNVTAGKCKARYSKKIKSRRAEFSC